MTLGGLGAEDQLDGTAADVGSSRRAGERSRVVAFFAAAVTVLALSACSQGGSKDYDIAPLFPLTADKCAKYDGNAEGSGFAAHCWVTKEECEQATQDWRTSMQQGGVTDATEFTCN